MSLDKIIASAGSIASAPDFVGEFFSRNRPTLAGEMKKTLRSKLLSKPDLLRDLIEQHLLHIESSLSFFDPAVYVDTLLWIIRTYGMRGFDPRFWEDLFNSGMNALKQSPQRSGLDHAVLHYEWLLSHLETLVDLALVITHTGNFRIKDLTARTQ
jgi:hypothetical protein